MPTRATGTVALCLIDSCRSVSQRAAQTLKWLEAARMDIISIALDHLTLGRAALYEAIRERSAAFPPLQRRMNPPPRMTTNVEAT